MNNKRTILMVMFVLGLHGCTTPYGNYASLPTSYNQQMAKATVTQVSLLYPPAKTRLNLRHPISDAYGIALAQALREKGYALSELPTVPFFETSRPSTGLDLGYTVTALASTGLYQVTVNIGGYPISRVFTIRPPHKLCPQGPWVHQVPTR